MYSGGMMDKHRTTLLVALIVIAMPAFAADDTTNSKLTYRGFTVDVAAIKDAADLAAIESSVKHQLDIIADCGAKPEIIEFFRGRRIFLVHNLVGTPGLFTPGHGIDIESGVLPQNQPVILHELLHAFHFIALSGGYQNPDILRFFNNAKQGQRYPASEYVLKNPKEFFAVTASLYLWGNVDRAPHTRENLREAQPFYYEWLGQQFGVRK